MDNLTYFYNLIENWATLKIKNLNLIEKERLFYFEKQANHKQYIEKLKKVFKEIDRAKFVPEKYKSSVYDNTALPTYFGQTISQPEIVFDMTYYLEINQNHKVLEIGTGVGYQTAILAKLAKEVYTIERIEELSIIAKKNLSNFNFSNIQFFIGDGSKGLEEFAPFDRIIVTATAPVIPFSLKKQLKKDGIMVIPVGRGIFSQMLIKYSKTYGAQKIYNCAFVKLIGEEGFPE